MRLGLTSLLLGAQLFPLRLTAGLGLPGFPKEALAKCAPQKPGLETFPGEEKEDLLRSLEYLSEPSEPHTLTAGLGTRMRGHAIRTAAEWLLLNSLLGLPFMVGAQLLSPLVSPGTQDGKQPWGHTPGTASLLPLLQGPALGLAPTYPSPQRESPRPPGLSLLAVGILLCTRKPFQQPGPGCMGGGAGWQSSALRLPSGLNRNGLY